LSATNWSKSSFHPERALISCQSLRSDCQATNEPTRERMQREAISATRKKLVPWSLGIVGACGKVTCSPAWRVRSSLKLRIEAPWVKLQVQVTDSL